MKLHEALAERGFHSTIMTTFCLDFDAYESIVLPRLRATGCTNNVVVADAGMLAYALDAGQGVPMLAGRAYSISGASASGVFHPKVWLQVGRESARMLVSSANLTAPGLSGNLEIVGMLAATPKDPDSCRLVHAGLQFVRRFVDPRHQAIAHQFSWMQQRSQWLFEHPPAEGTVELGAEGAVEFMVSSPAGSMIERFTRRIGSPVTRLIVVSPYWDEDLSTLRALQGALKPAEVAVLVGGAKPSFPSHSLRRDEAIRLFALEQAVERRFVHAKLIIAQTGEADHILFGSANCTAAALGNLRGFAGSNAEACLYRRTMPGSALECLGLQRAFSEDRRVVGANLPTWTAGRQAPIVEAMARSPGRFEMWAGRLNWWPTGSQMQGMRTIELLDADRRAIEARLEEIGTHTDGCVQFKVSELTATPMLARVRIGGAASAPAVIEMVDVLRGEIRELSRPGLEDRLDRLGAGTEPGFWIMDVIQSIVEFEMLEAVPSAALTAKARRLSSTHRASEAAFSTLTYDQFTSRQISHVGNDSARSAFEGSRLGSVSGYLNRFIGYSTRGVRLSVTYESAAVAEGLQDARQGATADPEPTTGDVGDVRGDAGSTPIGRKLQSEDARLRQLQWAQRLNDRDNIASLSREFQEALGEKVRSGGLDIVDILRARCVMTILLTVALPVDCMAIELASQRVIRAFGQDSWPVLIGQLLSRMFGGESPAIHQLRIGAEHEALPTEVTEFLIISAWAVQACVTAASARRESEGLAARLRHLQAQVLRTLSLGKVSLENQDSAELLEKLRIRFPIAPTAT